jgi:hypothetical protein
VRSRWRQTLRERSYHVDTSVSAIPCVSSIPGVRALSAVSSLPALPVFTVPLSLSLPAGRRCISRATRERIATAAGSRATTAAGSARAAAAANDHHYSCSCYLASVAIPVAPMPIPGGVRKKRLVSQERWRDIPARINQVAGRRPIDPSGGKISMTHSSPRKFVTPHRRPPLGFTQPARRVAATVRCL